MSWIRSTFAFKTAFMQHTVAQVQLFCNFSTFFRRHLTCPHIPKLFYRADQVTFALDLPKLMNSRGNGRYIQRKNMLSTSPCFVLTLTILPKHCGLSCDHYLIQI